MDPNNKHLVTMLKIQQAQQQQEMISVLLGTSNKDPLMSILDSQLKLQNFKLMTQVMKNQQQQQQHLLKQHELQMKKNNQSQIYGQQNQGQKLYKNNNSERNNRNQQNVSVNVNVETLKCPLSGDFFQEAYSINNCGHNFEKNLIEQWLSSNTSCPVCRKPANKFNLTKNYALQEIVDDYMNQK